MAYQVSTSHLDSILGATGERFKEVRPSLVQQVSSKLLSVATVGLVVCYLAFLAGGDKVLAARGALVFWVLQLILATVSWRLIPVVKKQRRLYRELDLLSPEPTPGEIWKMRSPRRQGLVRASTIVLVAGFFVALAFNSSRLLAREAPTVIGVAVLLLGTAYFAWSERKMSLDVAETLLGWIKYGLAIWVGVLFFRISVSSWEEWVGVLLAFLWPAWLLVKSRQMARIRDRFSPLARAQGLYQTLSERRREANTDGSSSVRLDPREASQLAYAERDLIRQSRVTAISQAQGERGSRYPVFLSSAVRERIGTLEPQTQLAIQDALSELAKAASGEKVSEGWPVGDTGLLLLYSVSADPKRVTIDDLGGDEAGPDD